MIKDLSKVMELIRAEDPNFSVKGFIKNSNSVKCKACGGENGIHKDSCSYMSKYINNDK